MSGDLKLARWGEEAAVWAHAYAVALSLPPALGEVQTDLVHETERMRSDRCAFIADLAVYRFRERLHEAQR